LNTPIARDAGGRGDGDDGDRYSDSYSGRRGSSSDLDYLLDEDEEPKRGWIKVLVGLVALALAVGFGYLHYQQGGFEFLRNVAQKPATATPDSAQSGANPAGQSGATTPDNNSAPPSAATPAAANSAAPASSDSNATPPPSSQNPPANQNAATQNAAPANAGPASTGNASDSGAPAATSPAASTPAARVPAKTEEGSDSDEESSDAEAPAPKAVAKPTAKPAAAKPSPARAIDRVQEAERYIYGRGVPQDCDRGVRLLKADQGDAKAMISLGGLYTTGTCTPRDLPTAYRWFAMALHKQPDNQALQDDLQKLWSQMTQPERQLAIKLSQ
jgi:TPR repeat protein